jgi:hypothetical protein
MVNNMDDEIVEYRDKLYRKLVDKGLLTEAEFNIIMDDEKSVLIFITLARLGILW